MPTATETETDTDTQFVYFFGDGDAEGSADLAHLLGGKGSNLAEMSRIGVPVPPGFTLSTEVCNAYFDNDGEYPEGLRDTVDEYLDRLEGLMEGQEFGDAENPLLLSIRSGAPVSMPGMMDTVLNLGLNDTTVKGLEKQANDRRFAYDSYRRFVQMYGDVVEGIDGEIYENLIDEKKEEVGADKDTDLDADDLADLVEQFKDVYREETGEEFPDDPYEQLWGGITAVFESWNNERAVKWREINDLPHDVGTAVNVQVMVFGNMGADCATGVAFTRDAADGTEEYTGEYLPNAQGEDVVAGVRTPRPINEYERDKGGQDLPTLEEEMPEAYEELSEVFEKLEDHYKDMQDIEFTVQDHKLYILQTRTGKRTAQAMVKIAHDMAQDGLITRKKALDRVEPDRLDQLLHPNIDPEEKQSNSPVASGLGASPGAARGKIVFEADRAEDWVEDGEEVVLVRRETSPEDIGGMNVSEGILTSRGGGTSHAAVVARGMGKPCVAGCGDIEIDYDKRQFTVDGQVFNEGDWLTLDGAEGDVYAGQLEMVEAQLTDEFQSLMEWADQHRDLGVRTNADTPEDAKLAREFGAEGIGLCRTEHMFFEEDRIKHVREMILVAPDVQDLRLQIDELEQELENAADEERDDIKAQIEDLKTELEGHLEHYNSALKALEPEQQDDFRGIFEEMDGHPVTVRLLDPPLHEFLPQEEAEIEGLAESLGVSADEIRNLSQNLEEFNPMLGHRGCRLGLSYPEVYEMQARAIMSAAVEAAEAGVDVQPEIMIPLVSVSQELEILRERVDEVVQDVLRSTNETIDYKIGTMIELPRACLTADDVAEHAEFFSFGTNDLTQTTFGISRDDANKFMPQYQQQGILDSDPFAVLDQDGVGQLIEMSVDKGRQTRPALKVGICGEHGGEPSSVKFCHNADLNYVSCSPYRVPIARLSAAQSAVDVQEDVTSY